MSNQITRLKKIADLQAKFKLTIDKSNIYDTIKI